MTTISRVTKACESPYAHCGVRAEIVWHRYVCERGFERLDVSTVAYDELEDDRRISGASHPACLWPDVAKYLDKRKRYAGAPARH